MTTMTRVGYCSVCDKNQRPKRGQKFLYLEDDEFVVGSVGKMERGITPHLYILIRATDKTIYYEQSCLMEGCGVERVIIDNKQALSINESKISGIKKTTIANWNALVMLKDF